MDHDALSAELLRAIRAHRSQVAFSRWLGYRSNVAYTWESGRRWPKASETLRAAGRCGIDVRGAFERFYGPTPAPWLDGAAPDTPEGVAAFLQHQQGDTPILEVAQRTGCNRFSVSRWLSGQVEPRLPDFLRLLDACSLRLLDLLSELVSPDALPSAAEDWERLTAQRDVGIRSPWSFAVLRAIELESYRALPAHEPGWIARRIGIDQGEEERCLTALVRAGQLRFADGRWVAEPSSVYTRRTPEASRQMKAFWARQALERLEAGDEGLFSWNVFSIAQADLERLEEMHHAYFRALRTLVASSAPEQRVVLANVQLLPLDGPLSWDPPPGPGTGRPR